MVSRRGFDELLDEVSDLHQSAVAAAEDLQRENNELRLQISKLTGDLCGETSPQVSTPVSLATPCSRRQRSTLALETLEIAGLASEEVAQPHPSVALHLPGREVEMDVIQAMSQISTPSFSARKADSRRSEGLVDGGVPSAPSIRHCASNPGDPYPLWSTWTDARLTSFLNATPSAMFSQSSLSSVMRKPISKIRGGDVLMENSTLQCLVMSPNSRKRNIWDLLSLVCVSHDVLTVPLIAFDALETRFLKITSLLTALVWTFDLPVSFLSGYYHGGVIEMRPSMLAKHYIRRWFFVDILVLVTDWVLISLESGLADVVGLARITKALRLSRILRVFRLVRVMKVPELVEEIVGSFASEGLITALGVTKSILLIIIINHFIACGWYAISFLSGEPSELRWVTQMELEGRDDKYRYATALHWSLTQFTPASMEVFPRNFYERVYAICVLISAMVTFSTFISSITSMMTTLRRIGTERSKQREYLRKYVLENQLSIELGNKIAVFLREQKGIGKKRVHESDIQVLKLLPEALTVQLHFEVYSWRLIPHPFFYHYVEADENGLLEICHSAMSELSLRTSDELFPAGMTATRAYILICGTSELQSTTGVMTEIVQTQWISEAVLWVKWVHRGRLTAKTHCEFIAIDSNSFRQVVIRRPHVIGACRDYARKYRERLQQLPPDFAVDVWCDFDVNVELAQTSFDKCVEAPPSPMHGFAASIWRSWSPRLYPWRRHQHQHQDRNYTI